MKEVFSAENFSDSFFIRALIEALKKEDTRARKTTNSVESAIKKSFSLELLTATSSHAP